LRRSYYGRIKTLLLDEPYRLEWRERSLEEKGYPYLYRNATYP
jgi:hypothetical protein